MLENGRNHETVREQWDGDTEKKENAKAMGVFRRMSQSWMYTYKTKTPS